MDFTAFSAGMKILKVDLNGPLDFPDMTPSLLNRLKEFGQRAHPSDVFFYYCSNPEEWRLGMGSEGFVAVRNGEVVDEIVWRMN